MMLGRVDPQGSLLEPGLLFGDLVTRGSFHDKLAACGHELISDDDFVGLYALNRGRPSIPPSLMMRGLLLAVKDDTSDRESARRSRVDLDWKHALGVASDFPGIGATTFSLFRSRVVLDHADQRRFRKTVRKAVEAVLFSRKILALIDSSPGLGAGAVQDTYELVRSGIKKVVEAAGEASLSKKLLRALRRYLSGTKPKIDWQNPGARQLELARMVAAANRLLEAVKDREDPKEAAQLLAALVAKAFEIDPDTGSPASARVWRRTASCRPPIPRC